MNILKYIAFIITIINFIGCGHSSNTPTNKAPTVNAGKDITVERNQEITLKGVAKDSDGVITSYIWKKGSKVISKKASFKYTPKKVGKETLVLTVTDNNGAKSSDEIVINVTMRSFITTWQLKFSNYIKIPIKESEEYNYSVDWGDGEISKNQTSYARHIYKDTKKIYTIKIWGKFPRIYFKGSQEVMPLNILSIKQWGDIEWSSMAGAFVGCPQLKGEAKDTPDLSNVTDMSEMFAGEEKNSRINSFNQNINNWDVSNITNMNKLFYLSDFNQSLDNWDFSNVTDMSMMFFYATNFNQDISSWDISNVTNMSKILKNTSFSTENYDKLLINWSQLNLEKNVQLDVDSRYSNNLESKRDIFINQFNWKIVDNGKVVSFYNIYHETYIEKPIVDISNFLTTTKGVIAYKWEENGTVISDKSSLKFSNSAKIGIHKIKVTLTMFDKTKISENIYIYLYPKNSFKPFITKWKIFNNACNGLSDYKITIPTKGDGYNYTISWGDGTFDYNITGDISHTYKKYGLYKVYIRGDFPRIYFKYTCTDQLYGIEQWGDIEWKSMSEAFYGTLYLSDNNSKDTPNLSKVTDMSYMFATGEEEEYKEFNLDMSNWDVSNITNMEGLFLGRKYFNQDIGKWDTSNVTNMSFMFKWAKNFNQNISDWDVSNVTDMSYMFDGVSRCQDQHECNEKVNDINQDFSKWDISNVTAMNDMFRQTNLSIENYDKILYKWSELSLQQRVVFGIGTTKYHKSVNKYREKIISEFNWQINDGGVLNYSNKR